LSKPINKAFKKAVTVKKQSPYHDDVLDSSWEAGWQDAKNNKKGFSS
jgi:ribosome modulation factor